MGSPDAFNNMITGARCEGENNKYKVKTIIQDNGWQVAECPSEDWALII